MKHALRAVASALTDRATLVLFVLLSAGWILPGTFPAYAHLAYPLLVPAYLVLIVTYDGFIGLENVVYAVQNAVGGEWAYAWDAGLIATFYLFSVVATLLGRSLRRRFGPDTGDGGGDGAEGGGAGEDSDGTAEDGSEADEHGGAAGEYGSGTAEATAQQPAQPALRYTIAAGLLIVCLLLVAQGIVVQPMMTSVSCTDSGSASDGGSGTTSTATPDCTRTTEPATGARLYILGLGGATGLLGAGIIAADRRLAARS